MIRKYFDKLKKPAADNVKWRSHEPTRIEALSDAAFAFALSLLIISLEVPKSSEELLRSMAGFLPFLMCCGFIFLIWYEQYKFFRRYGMHDMTTIVLNAILIFVVLFYVYPLKFMLNSILIENSGYKIRPQDELPLLSLYNAGGAGIYYLFACMYYNILLKKEQVALTAVEIFETQTHFYRNLFIASVASLALLITLFGGKYGGAGMACYGLMGCFSFLESRRKKLFKKRFGNTPMIEPQLGAE